MKNFSGLLHAITALPDNTQLVLAGEGSLADALRREAAALGIADRVKFIGYEPNLLRWMQAADGFTLSSHWEGLPLTLLEAGACGLPCVSTAVAGATEIVAEGQTGFLAPAGSTEALSAAMTRLMRLSDAARQAMGEKARRARGSAIQPAARAGPLGGALRGTSGTANRLAENVNPAGTHQPRRLEKICFRMRRRTKPPHSKCGIGLFRKAQPGRLKFLRDVIERGEIRRIPTRNARSFCA